VVNVEVTLSVTPALLELNRIAKRFSNFTPLMASKLDEAVRDFMKRRFESEGQVGGGGRWVRLSPGYASFKRATVGGAKILQFSGSLMDAYTKRGAPHQVLRVGKDFYELTVDEVLGPRARGHQRGVQRTRLPRRAIIPPVLPKNFIGQLRSLIKGFVIEGAT
jgi:hypothetical protein